MSVAFTADPSFFPSPKLAAEAPPERLAYVAGLNVGNGQPDFIGVVDVDPGSPTYSQMVGKATLPTVGDELHHFGWNACSSALCPYAHPHLERRYLIVPGLRSSRLYIFDTKPNPLEPRLVKTIEAGEVIRRSGYSRMHTVHCGPDAIYISAMGGANGGGGPGGVMLLDHDTFDVLGKWEVDRGDQFLGYDIAWHIAQDIAITSEWATPEMFENGLRLDDVVNKRFGHRLHVWDLRRRRRLEALDLGDRQSDDARIAAGPRPDEAVRLRQHRRQRDEPGERYLALASRERQLEGPPGAGDPSRAGRSGAPAAGAARLRRGAAVGERHRPVGRRQVPVRLVLGDGRAAPVRRERPVQPAS